jgi:hypothetical protein
MRTSKQSSTTNTDPRWQRLQALLFTVRPGQAVTAQVLAAESGLDTETVQIVLAGLTRATLFRVSSDATYVRQRVQIDRLEPQR